jgi:hypothetical protein
MPAPKTILAFPAASAEPVPHIHVDDSDFEEPTQPLLPVPERPTDRPSADNLAALVDASREPPAWLGEPQWSADPVTGRLVLVAAYKARQLDDKGNVFVVECPAGTEVATPATAAQARALRTALVTATLRAGGHAWVQRGGAELYLPPEEQWTVEIIAAFRDGDAGVRARG